jgi:hypothetical protein
MSGHYTTSDLLSQPAPVSIVPEILQLWKVISDTAVPKAYDIYLM